MRTRSGRGFPLALVLLLSFFAAPAPSVGADLIWSYGGGSPNASESSNWVGGGVPAGGDFVVFGNTTPFSPCTWNLNITLASMSVTGSYASTVTFASNLTVSSGVLLNAGASAKLDINGYSMTVGGDWVVGDMKTTSTVLASSVTFLGSGESKILRTTPGPARFNNLVINKDADSSSKERAYSDIEVWGNFTVLRGSHTIWENVEYHKGDFYLKDGFIEFHGSTVIFNGTQAQRALITGAGEGTTIPSLYLQNPTSVRLDPFPVDVLVSTQPGSKIYFLAGGSGMSIGSMTVSGLTSSGRIQLLSSTEGLAAPVAVTAYSSAAYVYVRDINSTGGPVTAGASIDGGNNTAWTFSGADPRVTRFWKYGGSSPLASAASNWVNGGPGAADYAVFGSTSPLDPCTWDLDIPISSFSVTAGYASTVTLSVDLTVSSGVRLDAGGSAMLDINGRSLKVQGDWLAGDMRTTSTVAGSSVTFYGAGLTKIKRLTAGPARFNNLVIQKDAAAGVEERLLSDIEVAGNFTVLKGSHTAGTAVQYLKGEFNLVSGFLDALTSTMIFNGSSAQAALISGASGGTGIGALFVQNPSSVRFAGLPVSVFVATQPGTTLIFPLAGGDPMTVGSMTINGLSSSGRIQLLSPVEGSQGRLDVTVYSSASFAYVRDLNSVGGLGITAESSYNAGNNTNWSFPGGDVRQTRYWQFGGTSSSASAAGNWATSGAPSAADYVVFGTTGAADACLWDLNIPVSSFSVTGSYAGAVTFLVNMKVSSDVRVDAGASAALDLNGRSLEVQGDWIAGDMRTTSTVAGSSVTFYGAGTSKIRRLTAGPARFNNLIINKDAAAGVEERLYSDLDVSGHFTILKGSHAAGANVQWLRGDLFLTNGFLDAILSTVIYAGAAPQRAWINGGGNGNGIASVFVQNPSTVTLNMIPANVLVATTPASGLIFDTVSTALDIASATINGQAASSRLRLRGISPPSQSLFNLSAYAGMEFVDVKDINSNGGIAITATKSNDKGNNSNWTFPVSGDITPSSFTAVFTTSLTVHWDTTFPDGAPYFARLSSGPWENAFAGNKSSDTYNFFAGFTGLNANTTYYLKVATDAAGPYTILNSSPTLAPLVVAPTIYAVFGGSITANWNPLPAVPQSSSAEGYRLEASSAANFSGTIFSSVTRNVALSTLTVNGLDGSTTYYLRVASLGWGDNPNFLFIGSTPTVGGLPQGCEISYDVGKSGWPYSTIQAGVDAAGASLSAEACVVIRDNAVYSERVTVQNIAMNNHRLRIMTDLALSSAATVNPPKNSTAAFNVVNDSVTIQYMSVITTNSVAYGVRASSAYLTLTTLKVDSGGSINTAGIAASSWSTVASASVTVQSAHGLFLSGNKNSVSNSDIAAANSGFYALFASGSSSNTFTVVFASSTAGGALKLGSGAGGNSVSLSSFTTDSSGEAGVWIQGSSSNSFTQVYSYSKDNAGFTISGPGQYNALSQGVAATAGGATFGISMVSSNYNSVSQSFVYNLAGGRAVILTSDSNYNSISQTTIAANSSSVPALELNDSYGTILSEIHASNPSGDAVQLLAASNGGTIDKSTAVSGGAGGAALYMNSITSVAVTASVLSGPAGLGAKLLSVFYSTISFSTFTSDSGSYPALYLHRVASCVVSHSYIQGSTGAFIAGSTSVFVNSSVLVGTNTFGAGLALSSVAGVNFSFSSNTLSGGDRGAGLLAAGRNRGLLQFSTNTVRQGALYGIFVSTQGTGTQVWLTSNTVYAKVTSAWNSYGIYLDGLTTGATIQNNGIFYRGSGAAASTYGLYAKSAAGLLIDHNRIGQPGVLTGGDFSGVYFAGVTAAQFKFNDVHGAGSGLGTAYLLELSGSTVAVRNNVFLSSLSVTASSATFFADSRSGFTADYNDYFSSNSFNTGVWGVTSAQFTAGWNTLTSQDAGSAVQHPLWHDPSAGNEDYHPRSMRGRYSAAAQGFVGDAANSPLIDAGDPGEGVGSEPSPNGGLANQGSFGLTAEASKPSPAPASPAVASVFVTSAAVDYGTVSWSDGYSAEADLTAGFSSPLSSTTGNPLASSLSPQGLSPNTTYFFRVGATYGSNHNYASATPASTSTLANPPASAFLNLYLSSGSLTWAANSNPAGTVYLAQVSTDAFATINASSRTLSLSATFQSLIPNTTHNLRVQAINHNSVPSSFLTATATSTLAQTPLYGQIYAVYFTSVTANWKQSPAVPPEVSSMSSQGYILQASTAPDFSGTVFSSATTVISMSTLTVFGLGGATYYFRVGTLNWNSTPHYAAIGSTRTAKNLPVGCGDGLIVRWDGSQDASTIQGALNALPPSFNTDMCVVIRDTMTYSESVTVQNFTNNGYRLRIMADPSYVSTAPVVNPPAASTAAFQIMNASVTIEHILVITTNTVGYGIRVSSADVTLSSVSVDSGGRIWLAGVRASTRTLVTASSITVQSAHAIFVDGSSATVILSTGAALDGSFAALYSAAADSLTVTRSFLTNPGGHGVYFAGGSFARVDQSSFNSNASGYAALYLSGASYATVTRTPLYNLPGWAAGFAAQSHHNVLSQSSMTVDNGSTALFMDFSASNTVTQSLMRNPSGQAAWIVSGSHYNQISQSTMAAGSFNGLYVSGSSYNAVTQSYLETAGANAVFFDAGANWNTLSWSSASANCADCAAARFTQASSNTVTRTMLRSPSGWGAVLEFSDYNALTLSTVAASGAASVAVRVSSSAGTLISGNHVEGSTAAVVSGSTGTVLDSNVLVAAGAAGRGVSLDAGNAGLSMSSNVVTGGAAGSGLYLGSGNTGAILVSTNVFRAGAQYGVFAATQAAGAAVWLTSNTIHPTISSARDTCGIFLDGLATGATVQNNGIYYRGSGSMGSFSSHGIKARSARGLVVERNRISQPGVLTGGSFVAFDLADADGTVVKFNDLHAAAGGMTDAFLLRLNGSSGVTVKNNVFLSSVTVSGSSATIIISADSQSGFVSDYNTVFSSNSLNTGLWGATAYELGAAWFAGTGKDANSIIAHPLWADPSAGTEDYHPRSMRGRWDSASQSFLIDAATSRSVDGGDPGEPSAVEPDPDGGRVNQGSYGGTLEASKSAPPPGSPALSGVLTSSVAVSFVPVASDGYSVQASLAADFSGPVSSTTANAAVSQLSPQGLTPNTTYFLRAGAVFGSNTNFSPTTFATATLAALPASAAPGEVNLSSAALTWGAAGNPGVTLYEAQASTDNFVTVNFTSRTLMTSATFAALAQNTTHFLRVRAVNHNSVATVYAVSAATATLAAAPSGPLAGLFYSSGNITWAAAGNPAGTTYYAEVSTDNYATINLSSRTLDLSATFFTLAPNTTHYLRVRAEGLSRASAYALAGSSATKANDPVGAAFGEVHLSSAGLLWTANGNPGGTLWEAQVSTDNFATVNASSRTLNLSATFFSLLSNATHYLRVRAQGHDGGPSGFAVLPATATLAALPGSAVPSGVLATAARANWTANGNASPTLYEAQVSTDAFSTLVNSSRTQNAFADFSNLTPNTAYVFQVRALGHNGKTTGFTALPSTTTLLLPPAVGSPAFTSVQTSSATAQWTDGGNGPGTTYEAEISTDNFATVNFTSSTMNLSAYFGTGGAGSALLANTTHFFQVRAVNGPTNSGNVSLGSTSTLAALPASVGPGEVNLSSVALTWGASGNPGATLYEAQASTDNFATVNFTSRTLMTSATFAALAQNTTHFLRVRALNHNSVPTLYGVSAATATLAAVPSGALAGLFYSSGNVTWAAAGNPSGTIYYAEVSTDNYATINLSSRTLDLSATFFTLAPNTTHYLRVRAEGFNRASAYAAAGSSATKANDPLGAAFGEVHLSSAGLSWTANGNPGGTLWEAQVSTDNFATVNASSRTLNLSATFFSLLSNATHYLRVRAQGHDGGLSGFAVLSATATLAALPGSAVPSGVAATAARANWTANGNASPTLYEAQASTDAFSTLVNSSRTQNVFADFSNLTPNTAYVFQVRALGHNGKTTGFTALPSTTTLLLPPAVGSPAFTSVQTSSATAQWTDGGNGPGTTYEAEISTDNFATVNFTSSTMNLSAYFGTGGAGSALLANTTHFFQVRAVNGPTNSGNVSLGSTSTLAALPVSAAPGEVNLSSAALTWGASGNPGATLYEAQASTDNFATVNITSRTLMTSATFSALAQNTTHFMRVRAVNHNSVPTLYAVAAATATLAAAPSGPLAGLFYSSGNITWAAAGNPSGTTYYAEISTDNYATINLSSRTLNLSATFFTLAPNTTHYLRVRAEGLSRASAYAVAGSSATKANDPVGAVFGEVHLSSAGLSWTANGNPGGTLWEAQASTDNFATVNASSRTLDLSATFFSLLSNATHYLRVRAQGHDGAPSGFAVLPATATLAALPGSAVPSGVLATAARANWTANGNASPTLYEAAVSTDAFATLVNSSRTQNAFADFSNLTPNTAYVFQVRALGHNGKATAFAALPSTTTLLLPPGTAAPAFTSVQTSSASMQWSDGGNGPGTTYAAEISTDNFATINFASATLNLSAYFGTGGAGQALLVNTTHHFRVRVVNGPLVSAYVTIGSTSTLALAPAGEAFGTVETSSMSLVWTANGNPSGTVYQAQISTDNFSSVNLTSRTLATSATFSSLVPATTHYLRVRAFNHNSVPSLFTAVLSSGSKSGTPSNPFASVYLTSGAVAWGTGGNPAGTTYYAEVSTNAFGTINTSSRTLNLSATFFSLAVNTTHYFRVRAEGAGGNSSFVSPPEASTVANDIVAAFVSSVELSSAGFTWSANNPAGTTYYAQLSTDSFATLSLSSAPVAQSATFYNLASNSTYYFRVAAVNHGGLVTAYSVLPATATPAAAPASAPPSGVTASSARANWGANGNAAPTLYEALVSTDAFSTLVNSSRTQNAFADFSNLTPNTAYAFQVRAWGHNGKPTAYTALPSTTTLLLSPSTATPAFTSVEAASAAVQWTSGGNGPGTNYIVEESTDSFATVNFASSTLNLAAAFGPGGAGQPLRSNATHHFRVRTTNGPNFSGYVSLGSTLTLAALPGGPVGVTTFTPAGAAAFTLNWSSGTVAGGYNSGTTLYRADISLDSNFSPVDDSSQTYNLSAIFGGLQANRTYYARVLAVNGTGKASPYRALGSTATATNVPGVPAGSPYSAVATGSFLVSWTSNGNPAGTTYYAQISTNSNFGTVRGASETLNTSAIFSGLSANTTYFAQTAAYAAGAGTWTAFTSLASTATLANAPASPAAGGVHLSSAGLTWSANSNPSGTTYYAEISTDSFATFVASSRTLNLSATFFNLASNAAYSLRVRAVNHNAVPTAYAATVATATLAADPVAAAAGGFGVSSITANWLANGNAPGTLYEARISTDNFSTFNASSFTLNTGAAFTGLGGNTTHYFMVRAVGIRNTTAFTVLPATMTLLLPPAAAAVPFSGVGVGSATVAWADGGNGPGTEYNAQISSDAFGTLNLSSRTANLSVRFGTGGAGAALQPNTTFTFRVQTVNNNNASAFIGLGSTITLAAPPSGLGSSAVESTSATLSWSLNGNPAWTAAEVERSTDNASFAMVSSGAVVTFIDRGLLGCTPYYFRVRNRNGSGLATSYDGPVNFTTKASTPLAPSALSAASLSGNKVELSWVTSPSEGIVSYKLYSDAGAGNINYAAPVAVLTSTETVYTTGVLASSAAYRFGLRAVNRCGVEEGNTSVVALAASTSTLSAIRAAVSAPASGRKVKGNSLSLTAALVSGSASGVQQVAFQYRLSGTGPWLAVTAADAEHPNPDLTSPYGVHWNVNGLAVGSYEVRAVASDLSGTPDSSPAAILLQAVGAAASDYDINENTVVLSGEPVIQKTQLLQNGTTSTVLLTDDTSGATLTLVLPVGALSSDSVLFTGVMNPALPAPAPSGLISIGRVVELTLGNGQTSLSGGKTAELTFYYDDENNDGIVDGTDLKPENLKVYSYSGSAWTADVATSVDRLNRKITGFTTHFSFFAVFGAPTAADLTQVRVFPNPYKPNRGDPNQGKPFDASDPTSGIVFKGLPAVVTIKIYTLTGQLVAKFGRDRGTGSLQWDAKNDRGQNVASGGYLAVITSPQLKTVVKKIAIIR